MKTIRLMIAVLIFCAAVGLGGKDSEAKSCCGCSGTDETTTQPEINEPAE